MKKLPETTPLSNVDSTQSPFPGTDPEGDRTKIHLLVEKILTYLGIETKECSVVCVSVDYMRTLNYEYAGKNEPTDVLSFSQDEGHKIPGNRMLGDVVCAPEYIRQYADSKNIPFAQELCRCVVHGILHLLGMNHTNNDSPMLKLQEEIVRRFSGDLYFD